MVQGRPPARALRGRCGLQIKEEAERPYGGRDTPGLVREPEIPPGGCLLLSPVSAAGLLGRNAAVDSVGAEP